MALKYAKNGLRGHLVTSEVKFDLENQLRDFDYICFHVYLASIYHYLINDRRRTLIVIH